MISYEDKSFSSPVRSIEGRVELYEGSTLLNTFNPTDKLKAIRLERVGEEGKFFGFGVCQRLNVHLLDKERELAYTTSNSIKIGFNSHNFGTVYKITETHRDENTNELSITAYDAIYKAASLRVSDLGLSAPYTIGDFATACGAVLGLPVSLGEYEEFNLAYPEGANFEGTETLREALDDVAEATQTIYFINNENVLTFKRLSDTIEPDLTITREDYFTLETGDNRRLQTIMSATELGDNISHSTTAIGSTQYVRDNAFWDLREDRATLVENAVAAVGGMTIAQFDCSWRGNPLLEIGDKIAMKTKDGANAISFVLNDAIDYNGALSQKTQWHYKESEAETADNPATLGDALKQTFAKVDKVNKEITLVASRVEAAEGELERVEDETDERLEGVNADIESLTEAVNLKLSPEQLQIEVSKILADGVNTVKTGKGFTFDDNGLTVEDINPNSHVKIKTTISNNGMTVYADNSAVLTANDEGVKAKDLHATTYLVIGKNSRFEDWTKDSQPRTACFWIGG